MATQINDETKLALALLHIKDVILNTTEKNFECKFNLQTSLINEINFVITEENGEKMRLALEGILKKEENDGKKYQVFIQYPNFCVSLETNK